MSISRLQFQYHFNTSSVNKDKVHVKVRVVTHNYLLGLVEFTHCFRVLEDVILDDWS
jgi:hypothetical protein